MIPKGPSKRVVELAIAREAGYHEDHGAFARVFADRRSASRASLDKAWQSGIRMRENGIKCGCYRCKT